MSEAGSLPEDDSGRDGPLVPRVRNQRPVNRASGRAITAVIFAVVVFVYLIRAILFPFVIAGAVAFVCTPLIEWMCRRTRLPRTPAAAIVFVVLVAVFGGLGYLALPSLVGEVKDTVSNLQGTLQHAIEGALGSGKIHILGDQTDASQLAKQAMDGLRKAVLQADVLELLAGGSVAGLFGIFLTIVLLFYFLAGGPTIGRGLRSLVPPKQRPLVEAMWAQLAPVLIRYFAGVGCVTIYAIIAAYLGLGLFLHLKNAVVLAVITGFAEMIPVVGPGAAAVIAGFAAIRSSHGFGEILGYIVYAVALRLSIDQFVGPLILGRAGRVHPTLIIFCFLTGGVLFNVVGVVLAIPVALTIKTVLATLYEEPVDREEKSDGASKGANLSHGQAKPA